MCDVGRPESIFCSHVFVNKPTAGNAKNINARHIFYTETKYILWRHDIYFIRGRHRFYKQPREGIASQASRQRRQASKHDTATNMKLPCLCFLLRLQHWLRARPEEEPMRRRCAAIIGTTATRHGHQRASHRTPGKLSAQP